MFKSIISLVKIVDGNLNKFLRLQILIIIASITELSMIIIIPFWFSSNLIISDSTPSFFFNLLNENKPLPDLILVDGGKGQLSAAKSALDALGLGYVSVIGLAKRLEEVFKPGMHAPQNIAKTSAGLHLLRRIRDEVHRHAITFHRQIRNKGMTKSVFENISGMGEKRIKKLWKSFFSLKELQEVDVKEIMLRTGFSRKICDEIKACSMRLKN